MNTMQFTNENLSKMNRDRLVELIFLHGLPTSQAVAYHLIPSFSILPLMFHIHVQSCDS